MLDALLYFKVHYRHLMQNFSFSNNFAGNVFSEPRSIETLSATLSQESTITLERVARGKSLMHAWITNEALGTVSQRDS